MPLTITYGEMRRAVGRHLGYLDAGRDPDDMAGAQLSDVSDCIRSGLRRFYWQSKVAEGQEYHVWSFLVGNEVLSTASGTATVDLPSDYSSIQGAITYGSGDAKRSLGVVAESEIRQLQSTDAESGAPKYAAVRAKTVVTGDRTSYELLLYPTPDAVYSLTVRYATEADMLSDDSDYPLGGALHSETIIEACLAAAERLLDDDEGMHEKQFRELLAKSLEADKAQIAAEAESGVWPAESITGDELRISKAYLDRLIGRLRGFGPNPDAWTHGETSEVTIARDTGLRKFYSPPVLPGDKYPHMWSFLKPTRSIYLTADTYEYPLWEDYSSHSGKVTFAAGDNTLYPEVKWISEERIRRMLQQSSESIGRPVYFAVSPCEPDELDGTQYKLTVYPVPDTDYTLEMACSINPMRLSNEADLPLGGQPHAQTLIYACLAAAEEMMGKSGVNTQRFGETIVASVRHDLNATAPELGGMTSRSGYYGEFGPGTYHHLDQNIVTWGGFPTT